MCRTKEANMTNIEPGSPQWENICARCGLCCLVKYTDKFGNTFLTNIRCDMLNPENGLCGCYSADVKDRQSGCDSCAAHNGSVLNWETLYNDYVVPGFCAYVQKFGNHELVKKCAKRPNISLKDTVSESEVGGEGIAGHVIPGSNKFFKYNPHVNAQRHELMKNFFKTK